MMSYMQDNRQGVHRIIDMLKYYQDGDARFLKKCHFPRKNVFAIKCAMICFTV